MSAECEVRPPPIEEGKPAQTEEVKLPRIEESVALDYFSSLSYLSQRYLVEQEVLRSMSAWESLNEGDREQSIDNYFIQANVQRKYEKEQTESSVKQSVFPRFTVKSGEKIVVDFENPNGFSTWEDEHSGPFSWECKAQRDDNPFDVDMKAYKRKSKTPRERTNSGSEEKTYAFNPNKSIWDSPFLKADGANPLESSGFGDLFSDMGGLSLSPTAERCESPPLLQDLTFEPVQESSTDVETKDGLTSKSEVSSQQDDDRSSLGDYIEMDEPPQEPPVIKLRKPFSFRKNPKEKEVPAYATAIIPKKEKKQEAKRDSHYPLYEPEPIPQPRVYRKEAPKKSAPVAPVQPEVADEVADEIYEPVMVSGNAMAQPYEVVDLEQLNIESLPLPPEEENNDQNNDYYQTFDETRDRAHVDLSSLPIPDPDFSDVITQQPGFGDTLNLLPPSTEGTSPVKSGFSFLDDW